MACNGAAKANLVSFARAALRRPLTPTLDQAAIKSSWKSVRTQPANRTRSHLMKRRLNGRTKMSLEELLDIWKEVRAGLIAELAQIPAEQVGLSAAAASRSVPRIIRPAGEA